jgi:hypothetical protein
VKWSVGSVFDFHCFFLAILKNHQCVAERHFADDFGFGCPDRFVFGVQSIGQAHLAAERTLVSRDLLIAIIKKDSVFPDS